MYIHVTILKGNHKSNVIYISIKKNKVLKNFLNQGRVNNTCYLYNVTYLKEFKEEINKRKHIACPWNGNVILLKRHHYPK